MMGSIPQGRPHSWAAGGVSSYPLMHPIVGQGRFFDSFKHFIGMVDHSAEKFAEIYAVVAPWGIGKSRLGYELAAQVNGASPGWYVRDADGAIVKKDLFEGDAVRERYLALYLRYSQVATEHHNVDSWFAFGIYRALTPLARGVFDGSIQGAIAQEAYNRLLVQGFDPQRLAEAMELEKNYTDEDLYNDPDLAARLCNAAYAYLKSLGIEHVLIVLDELETVTESTTFGMETEEVKYLDGRAIKLIGKAIKEEDPRKKLPWLRYVVLCSPAIGEELRQIKSTARRFEMIDLDRNSFADVSDFVKVLRQSGMLTQTYPDGLVEAAYAMSAGNFGWFNVIMANVDEALRSPELQKRLKAVSGARAVIGEIFDYLVPISDRIRRYVLDHTALSEVRVGARDDLKRAVRQLAYGQLPLPLDAWTASERTGLLELSNEYDEPVASLYVRVEWDELSCSAALREAKFERDKEMWRLPGVEDELSLKQLLANLATYAIHTSSQGVVEGRRAFLVPLRGREFVQLVGLLYPHPVAEDAARALWAKLIGDADIDEDLATHIGPSVDMLRRLDIRYSRQNDNALIFGQVDPSAAFDAAMGSLASQTKPDRARQILVGAMRLLDGGEGTWSYDAVASGLPSGMIAIATPSSGKTSGLMSLDALKLHPKARAIFAWVDKLADMKELQRAVSSQFADDGLTPVIVFTTSHTVRDQFESDVSPELTKARRHAMLYLLSAAEQDILHKIGIARNHWTQRDADDKPIAFEMKRSAFNSAFVNRLGAIERPLRTAINAWRRKINEAGWIAWPFKVSSAGLKPAERDELFRAWRTLLIDAATPQPLSRLTGVKVEDVVNVLGKMAVPPHLQSVGYEPTERAMLFNPLDDGAMPVFPPFLVRVIADLLAFKTITLTYAEREWFWGYTFESVRPKDVFVEWMTLVCDLGFAAPRDATTRGEVAYELRDRSALSGSINEAKNWLDGEYLQSVVRMEKVFGQGLVGHYFGVPSGVDLIEAKEKIAQAENDAGELDVLEAALGGVVAEEKIALLSNIARKRLSIINSIAWVYDRDRFNEAAGPTELTVNLTERSIPLWERIKFAGRFAEFVERSRQLIEGRIDQLAEEMREETKTLKGFPTRIYTLTLEKIRNILAGAMHAGQPVGTTQQKQWTVGETLGNYLRELDLANARKRLEGLAKEVGVDLENGATLPLSGIDGQIVSGFRRLRDGFRRLLADARETEQELDAIERQVRDAPGDFTYPARATSLSELRRLIEYVDGELAAIDDESTDEIRSRNDAPATLGNFTPMMNDAEAVLKSPGATLAQLRGNILTVQNVLKDYYQKLLGQSDLATIERGLNALRSLSGKAPLKSLDILDIQNAGSLKAARALIDQRRSGWAADGAALLDGAGVSFQHWAAIVADIDAGREPQLDPETAETLVRKGLLARTYKLGGGAI